MFFRFVCTVLFITLIRNESQWKILLRYKCKCFVMFIGLYFHLFLYLCSVFHSSLLPEFSAYWRGSWKLTNILNWWKTDLHTASSWPMNIHQQIKEDIQLATPKFLTIFHHVSRAHPYNLYFHPNQRVRGVSRVAVTIPASTTARRVTGSPGWWCRRGSCTTGTLRNVVWADRPSSSSPLWRPSPSSTWSC